MAGDATFAELLTATAEIARPVVALDADGAPKTPTYEPTGESARVRITPARSTSEDDLLGRVEDDAYVIYAESADIRMGDRLVTRPVTTALSEDVEAGAALLPVESTDGLRDGRAVEVAGLEFTVLAVEGDSIRVTPLVLLSLEEGESVSVVVRYEVLAVKDVAGAGHHLRVVAVERG